jgi:hypothetical protein
VRQKSKPSFDLVPDEALVFDEAIQREKTPKIYLHYLILFPLFSLFFSFNPYSTYTSPQVATSMLVSQLEILLIQLHPLLLKEGLIFSPHFLCLFLYKSHGAVTDSS